MKRINQALTCVGGTKKGGRGRKASSLPAPFNFFYSGYPSFHLLSLCADRSRMWDKSVCCFWLLVHSLYLHPQTTWGSYSKMEISLFQVAAVVSEDDNSSGYKGSCCYFRHHVCCICCIPQLDSNLFTLIFDILMFNTGLPWLVKSGEKTIIWGREKLTGKSLRSQEVSFSGIWNRCQKRFCCWLILIFQIREKTPYLENVKWREMENT